MYGFLRKIRSLPEDARKFLAGALIVIAALGFFSVWGSFVSSRLVAIGPPAAGPAGSGQAGAPPSPAAVGRAPAPRQDALSRTPPTPVEGIRDTVAGLEGFFAAPAEPARDESRGFLAAVGRGIAGAAEFIYMKLARYVPPNL